MKLKTFLTIELKDKNGKVLKTIRKECKSYVRQMIDALRIQMCEVISDLKDTSGITRSMPASGTTYWELAAAANSLFGIQVGTGTNAVTISDYALQTLVAQGNGSGQLDYGAMSIGTIVIVGSTAKFTLSRTFTNNSGADITVQEVGLVYKETNYNYYFMIERTLLNFTIANGTSGTVTYTISVTA